MNLGPKNTSNAPCTRTYEVLKELAVDVFDSIQSEPVPPCCLYIHFLSQWVAPTKLVVRRTNLQYPGAPGEQIFSNRRVIMVDLQTVSTYSRKGAQAALHQLQGDNRSFQAHHLL